MSSIDAVVFEIWPGHFLRSGPFLCLGQTSNAYISAPNLPIFIIFAPLKSRNLALSNDTKLDNVHCKKKFCPFTQLWVKIWPTSSRISNISPEAKIVLWCNNYYIPLKKLCICMSVCNFFAFTYVLCMWEMSFSLFFCNLRANDQFYIAYII